MKKNILLVEDDAALRDLIREVLSRQYEVHAVARCSEAIEESNRRIDLALIDYRLPDGDGLYVLSALRRDKPMLPAIIMTAYGTEDLAIKAIRAGITDYIKKPFKFAYLLSKVAEILENKKIAEGSLYESAKSNEECVMEGVAMFIDDRYIDDLTLERVSGIAGMNHFKFCKLFKKKSGMNFTEYLNRTRMKRACHLLE